MPGTVRTISIKPFANWQPPCHGSGACRSPGICPLRVFPQRCKEGNHEEPIRFQETDETTGWPGRFGEYDEVAAPYAGAQGEIWDGEFGRRRFRGGQARPRRPAARRPMARTQGRRPAARFAPTRRRRRPGPRPHQRRRRRRFIMAGRRMMGPPSPQQGTEYMRWVQNALTRSGRQPGERHRRAGDARRGSRIPEQPGPASNRPCRPQNGRGAHRGPGRKTAGRSWQW